MLVGCVTHFSEIEEMTDLADIIELRLDYFEDLSQLKKPPLPSIVTFRKKEQGGARDINEPERLKLIEKALELGPEYCDLEADTDPHFIESIANKFPNVKFIGSYHNFKETPTDLDALLKGMQNPHFAIYKIAVTAQSTVDMLRLMIFVKQAKQPLVGISMGEYGKPSRIIGPIVGNVFDYAGINEDLVLHRYSLRTLHDVFHYRSLNHATQIYALIGDPVEASPGHIFHNSRFDGNAVYVKMRLRADELSDAFNLIKKLPFAGMSVTVPLKEAIIPFVDYIDPIAKTIGAINTISIGNNKLYGTNTDAPGALNAIERHVKVKGKRMAILGAGGTARAITYEAKRRGATVLIFNRTRERALALANEFGCSGYGLDEIFNHSYDILVNTIPPKATVIPPVRPKTTVMDVVYDPKETPLLFAAKQHGCRCIYGEEMFVEQAVLQQQKWGCKSFIYDTI